MISLNEFHELVGKTIMYCQCIENDVKWIYAGMLSGDYRENFIELEREKATLGAVLCKLQDLDQGDGGEPYFSRRDYKLLREITIIRNHWAHKGYTQFVYEKGEAYENAFFEQYQILLNDYTRLKNLSDIIERVRFDVLRKYGRI